MPEPYLEIANADGRRQVPVTDKPVTVGRHSSNLVVVMDGQASRYHCVIERTSDGFRVRDLDSSNGTRLNGKLVKEAVLVGGDVITIGKTTLKLVAETPVGAGARRQWRKC